MAMIQGGVNGVIRTLVAAFIFLSLTSTASAANYVVIANKGVSEDSLTKAELRSIFLGDKVKWNNKKYIKIVVPEDGALLKEFLQGIVNKTPSQFDNHWMKLIFTGKASIPQSFAEMSKLVEFVASHQGAVGFVAVGQENGSVKTISIK